MNKNHLWIIRSTNERTIKTAPPLSCIFEVITKRDAAMGGAAFAASFIIRRLHRLTQIIFYYN